MSLAIGSFADTLRQAIADRGLTLDRVCEHLSQRGISISAATLSYWQSGQREPSRRSASEILAHLEDLLDVPPGHLRRSLPLTRERPRRTPVQALDTVWPEPPQHAVLDQLDTRWDAELDRLTVHEVVHIGPDRRQISLTVRQAMRSRCDGPDRRVVLHCQDDLSAGLPTFRARSGCRVGRIVQSPDDGVIGAELHFLEPLQRGQTVIAEYEVVAPAQGPLEHDYHRRLRSSVRELLIEVQFDPAAIPAEVIAYSEHQETQLEPDPAHRVHLILTDPPAGTHGLRWSWGRGVCNTTES